MKDFICTAAGVVGGAVAMAFGGWSAALTTLVIFMAVDYLTGVLAAGVFHRSRKTEHGGLESRAGWKGLVRKGVTLLAVLVACRLDLMLGVNYVKDAAVIGFCANEALSIVENMALMGVKWPTPVMAALELLQKKQNPANDEPLDKNVDYKAGYYVLLDELASVRKENETLKEELTDDDRE